MAIQKITGDVIATSAVTADSLADTTITAAKLHTTLDLTGKTVTVATASAGDNDTTVASTAFVSTAVSNLVDSSPDALNTLNELAAALGDDANFSTTVTNSIALKAPLASPTFTGNAVFDTTTLVVDATNDRVGIGTTSPSGKLEVKGSGTSPIVYFGNGVDNAPNRQLAFSGGSSGLVWDLDATGASSVGGQLTLSTNGTPHMRIDSDGDLTINTGQLRVNTANWPTTTVGNSSGRHIFGGTAEPVIVLWNEASPAANNISSLFIGAKSATSATTFAGGWVRGGLENNSDSDGFLSFFTTYGGGSNAERIRIDSDGKVGIGTSSPTKRLQIESGSTDNDGLFLSHSDGTVYAKLAVKNPGVDNNTLFGAVSNNDLEIMTGNAERMRVQSNGNVLIDCTATSGTGISDGGFLFRTDTSSHRYMQISTGNTGDADVLYVYKKNGTGITGVGTLSTYGDGINLKGGNGLVSIGYGQSNFIEFLTSSGSGQPRIRPSATDTVDLGDTARRFKDLQLGGKIEFNKTNASGGGDHDFIKMGYNGSWSNNSQGLASISVDDGTGVVGRYGVTYDGSKGRFVITDMYHGGYGLSGDVFWVRGNGEAHFAGGGGDALTIGDGESNYVTINNASSGDVSSGYNIKSGSTITTSLYGNAGEGWTTLMSGGSLGFRVNQASSGFNPMNIDTSGRISMPYQPCFCVVNPAGVFPNSTTDPFGKTGNGGTGAYTLRMNVGSHFSLSTGRFTAPIAGNYYFSFSAMFDGNGSAGFDIKVNGTAVNGGEALDSSSDTYTQISGSILLALSANDYVTVVQRGRRIHQRYGSFEGFLVG